MNAATGQISCFSMEIASTRQCRGIVAGWLCDTIEGVVILVFYRDRDRFVEIMRLAIAPTGSFFSA
jgi:hypothetical protein